MKFLAQRVSGAKLSVDGETVSEIGRGLVVYFGVKRGDTSSDAKKCAEKIANLRVFCDEAGKMNLSVGDVGGEVLLVSQFTLYGDCSHGNRPSFTAAEEPARAKALYEEAASHLREMKIPVKMGVFGADMRIEQDNRGPVSVLYETN